MIGSLNDTIPLERGAAHQGGERQGKREREREREDKRTWNSSGRRGSTKASNNCIRAAFRQRFSFLGKEHLRYM